MALNPGHTLLNGHYHITRQLGRGGFGFVYLAQDTLLAEQVAIKELIPALVGDEVLLKRFLAEARATMRLRHRRIVGTHNVFREGGNYYIVMEYMPGGALEDQLHEGTPLPVSEAVRIAIEVCEGLAYAHQEGVVHCDLKPANILLDAGTPAGLGPAKVGDFGIAHVSGEMLTRTWMTPAGFVAGTLPYMSPEQADGVRDDPRIDVYALGAVLYRLLTGHTYLDFDQRETPGATADNVYRIRSHQPAPPSSHNPRIPPWLDGTILKALAKDPGERYATAGELRAALLRQRPGAAQPQPAPPPTRPMTPPDTARAKAPSRPAWLWPVIGAAVVLVLCLAVALALLLGGGDDGGREEIAPLAAATATERPPPATEATTLAPATSTLAPAATEVSVPTATATAVIVTSQPLPPPSATPTSDEAYDDSAEEIPAPDMVLVPEGTFVKGSTRSEIDAAAQQLCAGYESWCTAASFEDELPQTTEYLDSFFIDRYEVTNADYARCVDAGACNPPRQGGANPRHDYYGQPAYADYPVIYVTWTNADDYCSWLGARLPTADEWEKAARGPDGWWWPWGNDAPGYRANYRHPGDVAAKKNDRSLVGGDPLPPGSFPDDRSVYGLLDMAGNVMEWVGTRYDANNWEIRGGSWNTGSYATRAANRAGRPTSEFFFDVGFRCAADVQP